MICQPFTVGPPSKTRRSRSATTRVSVFLARTGHRTALNFGPLQRGTLNRPPGLLPLLQCALPATLLRARPRPAWSQP